MASRKAPEKREQRLVGLLLEAGGVRVWDTSQFFKAAITPGLPDLVCFSRTRMFFVEVKAPKGRLSAAQRGFQQACIETGNFYFWGTYLQVREQMVEAGLLNQSGLAWRFV